MKSSPLGWETGRIITTCMGVATSTPFDMVALNDLDRFYRVADVIDRMRKLGDRTTSAKQAVRDKLLEHTQHITEPWRGPAGGAPLERRVTRTAMYHGPQES